MVMQNISTLSSRGIGQTSLDIAEGVFSHMVDLMLWYTVYMAELSVPFNAYGKPFRASIAADRFLYQVNYDVIKHAIVHAKRKGWIKRRSRHAIPTITEAGKLRLSQTIPQYDVHRVWDGRMHLITYDIPEQRSGDRQLLRGFLRRIGSGRLQDSVWITPYNPIDTIRTFIEAKNLGGTVIVSDLGRDGAIGEEDLRALIVRVYKLEALNIRYEAWLANFKSEKNDHWSAIQYLSILSDDPQLPFLLLPSWWKGDQAYACNKQLLAKLDRSIPTGM